MDFLKALMLYMSLTFAGTVAAAPTPEVTATPTPAPSAIVTEVPSDVPTAADIPDAEVTAAPQASSATATPEPQATITPNPGYKTLNKGNKGDRVKKLQERLIELGYLTGTADGAYGNQTRKAVLLFQYYNGLQQDGVAGKMTQTILFEDENVVANPNVTPTLEPTAEATPVPETAAPETAAPEAAATEEAETEKDAGETAAPEEGTIVTTGIEIASDTDEQAESGALTELEDAKVVLNNGGEALTCLRKEDGVTIETKPRVYRSVDGKIYVALNDLAAAVEDWTWEDLEDGSCGCSLAGYDLALKQENGVWTAEVAGEPVELADGDILTDGSTLVVSADFLEKALNMTTVWDDEENTLILQVVDASLAGATD